MTRFLLARKIGRVAGGAILLAAAACSSGAGSGTGAAVGSVAPVFSAVSLQNESQRVRLEDYRGQTVIVNFWASWCVPCRNEFKILAEADARPDVAVLGVLFKDSADPARRFMADHHATWPGLEDDGRVARAYRVGQGIPVSIVVGPDGKVTKRKIGEITKLSQVL